MPVSPVNNVEPVLPANRTFLIYPRNLRRFLREMGPDPHNQVSTQTKLERDETTQARQQTLDKTHEHVSVSKIFVTRAHRTRDATKYKQEQRTLERRGTPLNR